MYVINKQNIIIIIRYLQMYKILQSKDIFFINMHEILYSYFMPVIYLYSHTAKYNGTEKTNNIIII